VLEREIREVDTEFGKVKVKVAKSGTDIIKIIPEYEDCKRIAKKHKIPLIEVMKKIK
jgi:pyridinium-3,5-bisthiocarboxylic acid mononucleotide nickel chelatase